MKKPKIAAKEPVAFEVKEGEEYYWCACGKSSNQPLCDGSHRGTEFNPLPFKAETTGTVYLCQCKHTANPPFCDGTHNKLDD